MPVEDAVLNMVVPLSESLLEMDTFVIQTMWGKNYFDTDSLGLFSLVNTLVYLLQRVSYRGVAANHLRIK